MPERDLPSLFRGEHDRLYKPGPADMPDDFDPPEGIASELFASISSTLRPVMVREKFGTNLGSDA